jgi:ubiquinone/menaquinone biosynthesis C-methylase UbiE
MKAAFDDSAVDYDENFTNTSIGRLQRNRVWRYLETTFSHTFPKNMLELNCGTGEDAIFFAKHFSKVLATDVSEQMLFETNRKVEREALHHMVQTKQLDITELPAHLPAQQYDLIFSNFGGLNCIDRDQMQKLFDEASRLLMPDGRIIMVIMPRFCAWETVYFSSKLNFKKAFRRRSREPLKADLGKNFVNTWYHSPGHIKRIAAKHYNILNVQPVGIALPPSYLQKTFLTKRRILNKLDVLENYLSRFSFFAGLADHYLIDLKLK